ncbi:MULTISPECIES: hypothetical protein [unclassified Pseudomonas]|uniref:hypothetical protein n=1 Tax=unclassified Pseudomonas TaxID=196821 RepID=UPI000FB51C70|nr:MULTISPECIES: hypothetical protein [unclassified Pseudomonas]MBG6127353.1 protein involved in sex pheromone biosynthesis [Pseudomonas sp. M2]QPN47338.1 hypothetical protein I5S86_10800 [Priestia aryabhattai]HDS1746432.1 hypothetical protein [Pseudomonas putida]
MKRSIALAMLALVSSVMLSGCFESEAEEKAKAQQDSSDKLWDIPPPKTPDQGFKP